MEQRPRDTTVSRGLFYMPGQSVSKYFDKAPARGGFILTF